MFKRTPEEIHASAIYGVTKGWTGHGHLQNNSEINLFGNSWKIVLENYWYKSRKSMEESLNRFHTTFLREFTIDFKIESLDNFSKDFWKSSWRNSCMNFLRNRKGILKSILGKKSNKIQSNSRWTSGEVSVKKSRKN